jgi:enterochelin esterase-like enzyme
MLRITITFATAATLLLGATTRAALTTVTIFSPSNNRNISFQVYTPPGYTSNAFQRYPLVISLHGIGGTSPQRANLYVPTLDSRINSGNLLPMVWLFPDGQTNSFYGDAFDGQEQVYSQIIQEELPYVEANYRTIGNRAFRAMEGFSMGDSVQRCSPLSIQSCSLLWSNTVERLRRGRILSSSTTPLRLRCTISLSRFFCHIPCGT